jgi:hypothetical protein
MKGDPTRWWLLNMLDKWVSLRRSGGFPQSDLWLAEFHGSTCGLRHFACRSKVATIIRLLT